MKVGLPFDYGSSAFVCLVPKAAVPYRLIHCQRVAVTTCLRHGCWRALLGKGGLPTFVSKPDTRVLFKPGRTG
jgi:hypothetical protein